MEAHMRGRLQPPGAPAANVRAPPPPFSLGDAVCKASSSLCHISSPAMGLNSRLVRKFPLLLPVAAACGERLHVR
jgi:hypothetical protein